jgi:hypothetical protein
MDARSKTAGKSCEGDGEWQVSDNAAAPAKTLTLNHADAVSENRAPAAPAFLPIGIRSPTRFSANY